MQQGTIGVGLVGYGLAGRVFHGMLVKATAGLEVRAIVTRDAERRRRAEADFPGAKVYAGYNELLDDPAVDLVVIGTPHDTHMEMSIAASNRKKHVVVDKIMATSVAEADAMIRAAKEKGVLLSVFQNRRWDSDFLTVKEAIARGWDRRALRDRVERRSLLPPSRSRPSPSLAHAGAPWRRALPGLGSAPRRPGVTALRH